MKHRQNPVDARREIIEVASRIQAGRIAYFGPGSSTSAVREAVDLIAEVDKFVDSRTISEEIGVLDEIAMCRFVYAPPVVK